MAEHGQVGQAGTTGIDLEKPRLRAVIAAVIALAPTPQGFTVSQLAQEVGTILDLDDDQYSPRHASDDLKKLRGKQWVHKIGKSRRYEPDPEGLKNMTALLTLREKVIKPVLAGAAKPKRGLKPLWQSDLDIQYAKALSVYYFRFYKAQQPDNAQGLSDCCDRIFGSYFRTNTKVRSEMRSLLHILGIAAA